MPATTPESPIRPRYHMLDAVRGFVLVHMVAFHFCFDWFVLFAGRADWPTLPAVFWWERFICCTFNLVSGMAFHLGRRHLYHSLLLNAVGTGVTAVTLLIMPSSSLTGMNAPDRPPTWFEAITPPFFTASFNSASAAVVPCVPQTSRPISSRIRATLSPTAGVGARERSTMPNGVLSRRLASCATS